MTSSVRVAKVTTGIGTEYPWSFDLAISPLPAGESNPRTVAGVGQQAGPVVSWGGLLPGETYTVTEVPLPSAFTPSFTCTGAAFEPVPGGFRFVAPLAGIGDCSGTNAALESTLDLVKTADGERVVGSWQAGAAEEALAYFKRKYDSLATEIGLLEQRIKTTDLAPAQAASSIERLRESVVDANAVGDLDSLLRRLDALGELAGKRREELKVQRDHARSAGLRTRQMIWTIPQVARMHAAAWRTDR